MVRCEGYYMPIITWIAVAGAAHQAPVAHMCLSLYCSHSPCILSQQHKQFTNFRHWCNLCHVTDLNKEQQSTYIYLAYQVSEDHDQQSVQQHMPIYGRVSPYNCRTCQGHSNICVYILRCTVQGNITNSNVIILAGWNIVKSFFDQHRVSWFFICDTLRSEGLVLKPQATAPHP